MAGLPVRGGGGGKLSLKRRREDREGALGTTKTSWFENQELSDAETTWISLLRTVDPHLNRSSLEKIIKFPDFHPKNSPIANPPPCLETFNCGTKTFEWVPFPVYRRDWKAADSGRRQKSVLEKNIPAGENAPDEANEAISSKSQTAKRYKLQKVTLGHHYRHKYESVAKHLNFDHVKATNFLSRQFEEINSEEIKWNRKHFVCRMYGTETY